MHGRPLVNSRCNEALSRSLERIADHHSWGSVGVGPPNGEDGPWITAEDLTGRDCTDRHLARMREEEHLRDTQETVLGNYLFRGAVDLPLRVTGYLFIAQRRLPVLTGNLAWLDAPWLLNARFLEPRLFVLPEDPLAEEPDVQVVPDVDALTDTLFAEVERAFGPLLDSFRARRFVATATAWGSILDALAQGVLIAGKSDLPMDEAWARWEQATAGRSFPVRRRPVRFTCEVDGQQHEFAVRAGCCLYFMTPEAQRRPHRACTTCYLTSDEERIAILVPYLRGLASGEGQEEEHGSG